MIMQYARPSIGLNVAEQFMIDFFNETKVYMPYSDAVYITSQMGYINAADFVRDCEKYGRPVVRTTMITNDDQNNQSNDNVTQSEHVVDLEDLLNSSESY